MVSINWRVALSICNSELEESINFNIEKTSHNGDRLFIYLKVWLIRQLACNLMSILFLNYIFVSIITFIPTIKKDDYFETCIYMLGPRKILRRFSYIRLSVRISVERRIGLEIEDQLYYKYLFIDGSVFYGKFVIAS